jgi:hypothetical protein
VQNRINHDKQARKLKQSGQRRQVLFSRHARSVALSRGRIALANEKYATTDAERQRHAEEIKVWFIEFTKHNDILKRIETAEDKYENEKARLKQSIMRKT